MIVVQIIARTITLPFHQLNSDIMDKTDRKLFIEMLGYDFTITIYNKIAAVLKRYEVDHLNPKFNKKLDADINIDYLLAVTEVSFSESKNPKLLVSITLNGMDDVPENLRNVNKEYNKTKEFMNELNFSKLTDDIMQF